MGGLKVKTDNLVVINLTTSGNLKRAVRIFSLRGAHLIAMFARTKIAKEFRKWVLNILDKEIATNQASSQETVTIQETTTVNLQSLKNLINNFLWIDNEIKTFRLLDAITIFGGYELASRLRGRINDSHLAIYLLKANKSLASSSNPR